MKLILVCHVALFFTCNPVNSSEVKELPGGLNGTEIDAKYTFDRVIHDVGGFAKIYFGTTNAEPKIAVAMKLENDRERGKKALGEINVFRHLHEKYGDLVQHHLINMLDFGTYKDKQDAIILSQTGLCLLKRESMKRLRKQPENQPDWPKICKLMTQLLHAVKTLHDVDIVHLDIKEDNVVFGREQEPVDGLQLPGVTYENDFYLLDMGNSKILTAQNSTGSGRIKDLKRIGTLLCWILKNSLLEFKDSPHTESDVKKYFDTTAPFKEFSPEIKAALVGYHQDIKELNLKELTEEQLKTAIDYNKLCSYFK